jgi:predicted amidophosphoribosyltransferase
VGVRDPTIARVRALLDLLVPPVCLACGRPGRDLCGACRRALVHLPGPRCPRCALPAPCGGRCPSAGHAYAASWSPVAYAGPARELVAALKFRGHAGAAGVMAAAMAAGAGAAAGCPVDLAGRALVPVPTHPARRRARGFDQAEELARALARRTGLPLAPGLARAGDRQERQLGASAARRRAPGRVAVAWTARAPPPAACVLVDDVHTTGATLDACARALRDAGALDVTALAYARTL